MSSWRLLGLWDFDWRELAGLALLCAGYLALCRLRPPRRGWYFAAGVAVLAASLISPIGVLADHYLFSAHMVQHIGIALVAPPLLLLGLPADRVRPLLSTRLLAPLRWLLERPPLTWILGVGTLWIWHLPVLYDAAVLDDSIHALEHLCFFASAVLFWWPVAAPLPESRLAPLASISYLYLGAIADGVLGILITFASPGLYPAYLHPEDPYGVLPLLRERLEISPAFDQQLGGLIMWVFGGGVLLGSILIVLARWLRARERSAAPKGEEP